MRDYEIRTIAVIVVVWCGMFAYMVWPRNQEPMDIRISQPIVVDHYHHIRAELITESYLHMNTAPWEIHADHMTGVFEALPDPEECKRLGIDPYAKESK